MITDVGREGRPAPVGSLLGDPVQLTRSPNA